jgi:hypothetical protein
MSVRGGITCGQVHLDERAAAVGRVQERLGELRRLRAMAARLDDSARFGDPDRLVGVR